MPNFIRKTTSRHPVVNEYFDGLKAKNAFAVASLFSEDAVVLPSPAPVSGPVQGRSAIKALVDGFLKVDMDFLEKKVHDDESSSTVELRVAIGSDKRILEVVDIFELTDGRISKMSVYKR